MSNFQAARDASNPQCFDWISDECSGFKVDLGPLHISIGTPDAPAGYCYKPSCRRHDFGYQNARKLRIFTKAEKARIDTNFLNDLDKQCATLW